MLSLRAPAKPAPKKAPTVNREAIKPSSAVDGMNLVRNDLLETTKMGRSANGSQMNSSS